jgi:predicted nucleotidyltransferase
MRSLPDGRSEHRVAHPYRRGIRRSAGASSFVGGCATALLITDPAAAPVRATENVDTIAAIVSKPEYHQLGEALQAKGSSQSLEQNDPPFRWTFAGMKLDVMPTDQTVLGFSNPWYESAMQTAVTVTLREGLSIRLAAATSFVATKLVAFLDRGKGDFLESHDLEDVLSVVDGRPELVDEFERAASELREYVASVFARLLADEDFINALPGMVIEASPAGRSPVLIQRLRAIVQILPS